MPLRVVLLIVDTHHERRVGVLCRSGDDHALCAGVEMRSCELAVGEVAGRLDHDGGTELPPREVGRLSLGQDPDLAAVDEKVTVFCEDLSGETPVGRVVAKQQGVGGSVG